jgi:hypothetical protein
MAMRAHDDMSRYVPDEECQTSSSFSVHLVNAFTRNALDNIASDVEKFF